jgi:putative AdoMet-dependent methyltransferase
MRSRHADTFNHDADAPGYDADVSIESHPVREAYAELLAWVARAAEIARTHRVLELGAGTGNLTRLLPHAERIVAVDVSEAMLAIAKSKVPAPVAWLCADVLEFFDHTAERFDRIISTYAIHHLTPDEKILLFERIRDAANPHARVVLGDLMFESIRHRREAAERYRGRWPDVAEAIETEFFWTLDDCVPAIERLGFAVSLRRFSDLSWGLQANLR